VIRHRFTTYVGRATLLGCVSLFLAACQEGQPLFNKAPTSEQAPATTTKFIEKDVEAPEVFQKSAKALWDGRPSLGGVWVAHPNVKKPERIIIRNKSNGKFVIGALFNRESSLPGPAFQLSSDAAVAIGAVAGTTLEVSVTAMRIKKIPVVDPKAPKPAPSEDIAESTLKALDKTSKAKKTVAPVKPTPALKAPAITSDSRFAQLGLFSVESNANATLAKLKTKNIAGKIVKSSAKGKTFYRVLAGPVSTKAEKSKLLATVKSMGFADAYFVKG